jgi:hypothetical protein
MLWSNDIIASAIIQLPNSPVAQGCMKSNSSLALASYFESNDCALTIIPPNASNLVHSPNHSDTLCPLCTSTSLTCPNCVAETTPESQVLLIPYPTSHKPQPRSNARVISTSRRESSWPAFRDKVLHIMDVIDTIHRKLWVRFSYANGVGICGMLPSASKLRFYGAPIDQFFAPPSQNRPKLQWREEPLRSLCQVT